MAIKIIIEDDDGRQAKSITVDGEHHDEDWEEECYQLGCEVAKEVAKLRLGSIEERLFGQRPKSWRVEGFRKRMRVARFGEFPIYRRLYRDKQGEYHFLLDEYLNWRAYRRATPSLTEALMESSTRATFREVSRNAERFSAGVLSSSFRCHPETEEGVGSLLPEGSISHSRRMEDSSALHRSRWSVCASSA